MTAFNDFEGIKLYGYLLEVIYCKLVTVFCQCWFEIEV